MSQIYNSLTLGLPKHMPAAEPDTEDYDVHATVTLNHVLARSITLWSTLRDDQEHALGKRERFLTSWTTWLDEWRANFPATRRSAVLDTAD